MKHVTYARTVTVVDLNEEELRGLVKALTTSEGISPEFIKAAGEELNFRIKGPHLADEMDYPVSEQGDIIRCVHEGVCPVCGRRAHVIKTWDATWLPDNHFWRELKGETDRCLAGHEASVEPSEGGSDWDGWIVNDIGDLR